MTQNPEIIVLHNGYSRTENESLVANCTCTLIKGAPNIIVDTMTAWDGAVIKKALQDNNVNCDDIQYVVNTHGHSDHIGCNYLFPKATHVVGFSISHRDKYLDHDFNSGAPYVINSQIKIVPTPGHTLQDVSVIVSDGSGRVTAITGDLFEREEDLMNENLWKEAGSDSEELQVLNRNKILEIADFIIPGHGPMFQVKK